MSDHKEAITIYQPFATLCILSASGANPVKRYETRGWIRKSLVDRRLLVHAGQSRKYLFTMTSPGPIRDALAAAGINSPEDLPFGAIVGSVVVKRFWKSLGHGIIQSIGGSYLRELEDQEPFGDFSEGRYAWELSNPVRVEQPVACKGMQGIWRVGQKILEMLPTGTLE